MVYLAFMGLEKAYDRVDREDLCQVMRIYGTGGNVLRAIMSVYDANRACGRVGGAESECQVEAGLCDVSVVHQCVYICILLNKNVNF